MTGRDERSRPTWLTERCPAWCAREHGQLDHPDDRYHQSEPSVLPGVVATRATTPLTGSLEGLDLVAWLGRYVGERLDWMVIEPVERREPRLVLTVETARTLIGGLAAQLARHDSE